MSEQERPKRPKAPKGWKPMYEKCVNGCDKPVQYPSKVICADCMDGITRKLEAMLEQMEDSHE